MSTFATATLTLLPKGGSGSPTNRSPNVAETKDNTVTVQFNPTTLRLQRQGSQVRGGVATKTQQVQYPSSNAATLSFDLEFDTAEEFSEDGTSMEPVDVRTRTGMIHRFVEPSGASPASAPHRILFKWGTFAFQGVVTQLTEEFDYFAPNGTPLRAKLSLTIEEQNPKFEAMAQGNGARSDGAPVSRGGAAPTLANATSTPPPGAAPGQRGTRDPLQAVAARAGESVQQVAARLGGDPGAWRSLMNDLPSPTALAAGTPVMVGPELETSTGPGRVQGFAQGATVAPAQALAGALGLPPGAGGAVPAGAAGAPAGSAEAAGFALSAAGGVAAAINQVRAAETASAVDAARSAFAARSSVRGDGVRSPVRDPSRRAGTLAAGDVDPRAIAYGRAIPLRSQVHAPTAGDIRNSGRRSIAGRAKPGEVAVAADVSVTPWERLGPAGGGRADADRAQRGRDARASTMRWRPGGDCR